MHTTLNHLLLTVRTGYYMQLTVTALLRSTGDATPLIDIHDVEHVTLINVTVSSLQPAKPNTI
jgi:hypothetical protein